MKNTTGQKGQVLVLGLVVLGVVLINTLVIISGSQVFFRDANYTTEVTQVVNLAEAGVDKAISSLNATGGTYSGENETAFGEGSYSVKITTPDSNTKVIESTGYLPSKDNPKTKRTVKVAISRGIGVSFNYGIQVGEGGLEMGNSNSITGADGAKGSVYSNGSIVGGNSNTITGDVWIAGGVAPIPDQETDCVGGACTDFIFGTNVAGQSQLDVAQSFRPTSNVALNKVSLKLKKFNNPSDVIIRILADNGNKPDKTQVLTIGTLPSSFLPTTTGWSDYGWVEVAFASIPNLAANTPYWIMIDTSLDTNNYWAWQNDSLQSYIPGNAAWSTNWNTKNPLWNNIVGDLSFKTYVGGLVTSLIGGSGFTVGGNVHANTINGITIQKDAYYQSITASTVNGTSYPSSPDSPPKIMPISDPSINEWKSQAQGAGTISTTDITSCRATLGPGVVNANVSFGNCPPITIRSPLWITGNFSLTNGNTLRLDASYAASSGIIIVDGISTFNNGNQLVGSGTTGSYLMLLSTYDSPAHGNNNAITINNSGNSGVLYAGKGKIDVNNSNSFKELTAWAIELGNSVTITYQTGLSGIFFSSGPSGSFSIVPGTYQLK